MTKEHGFVREEVLPSWFLNVIQEYVSGQASDLRLSRQDGTHVQVVPRAPLDIAVANIQGRYRYRTTTVSRAHPGGGNGTYAVWIVATDTVVDNSPDPFTDHTNYSFDLRITSGADPSGAGVEIFEKIGEVDWFGGAITAVRQTYGSVPGPLIADGALSADTGLGLARQPDGSLKFSVPGPLTGKLIETTSDEDVSRFWIDPADGIHAQLQNPGLNGGLPFRTLDFDPDSLLGLRLHSVTTQDVLRVDPVGGTTFKLAATDDPGGDLGARWIRQSDGSLAAKAWGDNLGDDTLHGQYNARAYAKAGGVAQVTNQAQVGLSTAPGTWARTFVTANLFGISSVIAGAQQGGGDPYSVTLVRSDDGRTVLNFLEMGEMAAPAAAPANAGRLFVRDSGGKSQLCARFPTGAVVPIATEP